MKMPTAHMHTEDERVSWHVEFTDILRTEVGMKEEFASPIAAAFLRGVCSRMGGKTVYIPAENRTERNAAIRAMFDGTNIDEVCQKFGISRATAYRITGQRLHA
jgi:Mor family transcriptional regulator